MRISYTKDEYNKLQKEVCYIMSDLKQLTDSIVSNDLWNDFEYQSNATCKAISEIDLLKNYLVQMNFITYNVAIKEVRSDNTDDNTRSDDSISNNAN